jgi:hypothetical protein
MIGCTKMFMPMTGHRASPCSARKPRKKLSSSANKLGIDVFEVTDQTVSRAKANSSNIVEKIEIVCR